jgi:uncharacterized membrane protein YhaH (DUF805 family)
MKKYYYSDGKDRVGPLTIEELKSAADLTPETLVWYAGLPTWVRAADVAELSDVFMSVPPPVPPGNANSSASSNSVEQSMFANPFSFTGRIRRQEYGLSLIISVFIAVFSYYILMEAEDSTLSLFIYRAIILLTGWFVYAQGCKRSHDIGKSGWWQLIPFYNLYILFAEGDRGYNAYGANPKGGNNTAVPRTPYGYGGNNVNTNSIVINMPSSVPPPSDTNGV